jgi:hypothetical protein
LISAVGPSGDPAIIAVAAPQKGKPGEDRAGGAAKQQDQVNGTERRSNNASVGGR